MKRSQNLFTEVPVMKPKRNFFDLSHEVKMSGKFAYLYPVMLNEVMPGDRINGQSTVFARFAPMLAPIMHRCDITVHTFMVPYRIISAAWESFITGGQEGDVDPAGLLPFVRPSSIAAFGGGSGKFEVGSLWDYMGLPCWIDGGGGPPADWSTEPISALPFLTYLKIWDDFYRDPNLDESPDWDALVGPIGGAGDITLALYQNGGLDKKARGWQKDYFTSALPWAQRGEEVLMPLSGTGTVTYKPFSNFIEADGGDPVNAAAAIVNGNIGMGALSSDAGANFLRVENINTVNINASSVSINDLRTALALQRWMENNARGGARYIEQIESHYGVRVPDYRLQRAEYVGGQKQPVQISQVLATADSDDVPVGDMAGHGVSVGNGRGWSYQCKEHGMLMSILSCIPQTAYSQGIEKHWLHLDRFDFAFPELAHLGEQEILSKELFFSYDALDDADNQEIFGYIPRYAEYKFKNDRIAGDFRTTLGFWHLGRNFQLRPTLNSAFTTMNLNDTEEENFDRIFAVQDGTDYIWMQLFHKMGAVRPLPYFGVPRIIG